MGDNFNVLLKAFKDALDFSENNFLSFAQCHKWRGRETKWWQMVAWDKKGLKIMIIVGGNFLNSPINIKDIYIYILICRHTYMHACMDIYMDTDIHTHTYIHTYINAYKQTCHINQANVNVTIFDNVVLIRKETIRLSFHVSISKIWKLTEW